MEYIIDAKNKRLGRVASEIAVILQGKKTVAYAPNKIGEDKVVVKNAALISVSGGKEKKKIYYKHTGYMGHLREKTFEQRFAKSPERVLRDAVENMLPRNFIRAKRLNRLKIEK
jgi:large subunit ribosomal protein L13